MRGLTFSLVVIASLALAPTQAAAVDITECGQVVPAREVGNLIADLDCSDPNQSRLFTLLLEHRATLNLNGFSVIGPVGSDRSFCVFCDGSCRVNGPGTITGCEFGIAKMVGRTLLRVTDTISGTGWAGISAAKVKVFDSAISDNLGLGIWTENVLLRNVTVTGNGDDGVAGRHNYGRGRVIARDSEIVDNGIDCPPEEPCYDISAGGRLRLRNTTVGTCSAPGGQCP
jgi:hypothetical protein